MRGKINIKRYFQTLGICLAVLAVGLLAALGFGFWETDEDGLTDDEIATVEIADGKINVLLMGVDEGGLRTDCIMIGSYDTENKKASLLSIPRDTRIYIGSKYQKVNAAHAIRSSGGGILGAQGTVEAVTRMTGIPINFYVELPFSAVEQCIDLMGPVTFEVPDLHGDGVGLVYDDPVQDLHINLKPGVQELSGEQCVHLLRYRKGNLINGVRRTYAQGDMERIGVQQEFLKALVDQKLNASLILKLPAMFKQLSGSIKTNMSVKDVIKYSKYLTDFKAADLQCFSLPGAPQVIDGVSYWVCDIDQTKELIRTGFGYDAENITIDKAGKTSQSSSGDSATKTQKPASAAAQSTTKPVSSKSEAPQIEEDEPEKTAIPTKKPASTAAPTKAPEKSDNTSSSSPASTKTPTKDTD